MTLLPPSQPPRILSAGNQMEIGEKQYRVGDPVRVRSVTSYPLPVGLAPGAPAKVIFWEPGHAIVQTEEGREWSLAAVCVIAGWHKKVRGRWIDCTAGEEARINGDFGAALQEFHGTERALYPGTSKRLESI